MDFESLYQWVLKYGYHVAQICLVITAAMMVKARKGAFEVAGLVGFTAFLVGSLMMHETKDALVHLGQFNFGSRANRQLWQAGQAVSIFGFLAGALALMLGKMFKR
jgi:hypothetical protein